MSLEKMQKMKKVGIFLEKMMDITLMILLVSYPSKITSFRQNAKILEK
jgi:hypothetical protein